MKRDPYLAQLKRMCKTVTMDFRDQAACRGLPVEMFFPEKNLPHTTREICEACPVQMACLAWGIAHEKFGFWGAHSDKQRRKLRKQLGVRISVPTVEPPPDHGTNTGYQTHLRRGEPACEKCKRAHSSYWYNNRLQRGQTGAVA